MSHRGAIGHMGWASNEHPIVVELIKQWNKLGVLDGYILSDDDRLMPQHLKNLMDVIEFIRDHLRKTTLSPL